MQKYRLLELKLLEDRKPKHAQVNGLDLVVIRYDDQVSVLYGRCLHRGALMADGFIQGDKIVCGVHNWDYRYDTSISQYNNSEYLHKFTSIIKNDWVIIDEAEITAYLKEYPQPFDRSQYLGQYADTHPEATEPYTLYIKELAKNGLKNYGHHGPSASMGVDRNTLPKW